MSAQMIELLIFAGIAVFIISKLLSKLGSTSDDDPAKPGNSLFGEPGIKNVTHSAQASANNNANSGLFNSTKNPAISSLMLEGLIIEENKEAIITGLETISSKLLSFQPVKFLQSAKLAFELIIEAANDDNIDELVNLVDKRYIQEFHVLSEQYGNFVHNSQLEAKISEAYSFANNVFIKVLFSGNNITDKIAFFNEEWTFSKNVMSNNINWFLNKVVKVDNKKA